MPAIREKSKKKKNVNNRAQLCNILDISREQLKKDREVIKLSKDVLDVLDKRDLTVEDIIRYIPSNHDTVERVEKFLENYVEDGGNLRSSGMKYWCYAENKRKKPHQNFAGFCCVYSHDEDVVTDYKIHKKRGEAVYFFEEPRDIEDFKKAIQQEVHDANITCCETCKMYHEDGFCVGKASTKGEEAETDTD